MSFEMFGKLPQEIYETVSVWIFIIGLILTILFAIVTVIRHYKTDLEDTAFILLIGFLITIFTAGFWPLAIVAIAFTGLAAIIYYPARRFRKNFW